MKSEAGGSAAHKPVLLREVLKFWHVRAGGFYVDSTLGLGGHTEALLAGDPEASCLGIDADPEALRLASQRLQAYSDRLSVHHGNFADLKQILEEEKRPKAHGILVDLGVSSLQLDKPEKGFSFMRRGPLDMRMDPTRGETARELIERLTAAQLARVLRDYGEEELDGPIARALKNAAGAGRLNDTLECADLISKTVLSIKPWISRRIHPATQTFQALRIAVNRELDNLRTFLETAADLLVSGGRLAVISFHSLEDRLVKNALRDGARGCVCPADFPACVCGRSPLFKILTRKSVRAGEAEVSENPRSRSARLRVAEKI